MHSKHHRRDAPQFTLVWRSPDAETPRAGRKRSRRTSETIWSLENFGTYLRKTGNGCGSPSSLKFAASSFMGRGSDRSRRRYSGGPSGCGPCRCYPIAVSTAAKKLNAPESLILQGVKAFGKELTPQIGESLSTRAAKLGAGFTGAQAGAWVRVQTSDKKMWEVHPEDVAELQRRDPTAKILDQPKP